VVYFLQQSLFKRGDCNRFKTVFVFCYIIGSDYKYKRKPQLIQVADATLQGLIATIFFDPIYIIRNLSLGYNCIQAAGWVRNGSCCRAELKAQFFNNNRLIGWYRSMV